jgi:outer membrane protein
MRRKVCSALLVFLACSNAEAQQDRAPKAAPREEGRWWDRVKAPYVPEAVPSVNYQDSPRIDSLMRDGKLYLSLADTIALTIENNLDVELQRFGNAIARTDTTRAEGGGLLRGLQLTVNETPLGTGGPASNPLLTTATSGATFGSSVTSNLSDTAAINENQTNLSVFGTIPQSTGTLVPQFDPAVIGTFNWSHSTVPQNNSIVSGTAAAVTDTTLGNLAWQQGFSAGTLVNLGWDNQSQSLNSIRSSYNPYTQGSLGLNVTQPLLRGFGPSVNRRFIRIAKNDEKITNLAFRQQLIATVYGVVRLYDDLVSLNEDLRVKEEALRLAQKLYDDTKAGVETGTQAPLELTRAQAQIAISRQALVTSQGLIDEQELILKNILTRKGTEDQALSSARIVPTDPIVIPEKDPVEPVQDLVTSAFKNRPDLEQAQLQIVNSEIGLQGSRNAALPELDLVGVMQNNGLSGSVNPLASAGTGGGLVNTPDPGFVGGYGNLLGQIFRRNYPTYAVGLQLTIPVRNRIAQADIARDELQIRQSQIRLQQLRKQARLEVEDALVAVRRSRAAYEAAVQSRMLQEQSLEMEQEKFRVGASTSFFIVQYQSYLAQARSTEVASKSAYVKARTALDRATGMILDKNNVVFDEALRGSVSRPPAALP